MAAVLIWLLQSVLALLTSLPPGESSDTMPSKYEIITPIHFHPKRHRRDLSTREQDGHLHATSFGFNARERHFRMEIYLNQHLLNDNFHIGYQLPDGQVTMKKFKDHCYYHGTLSGASNTSVVLSTCNGLRGTIQDESGKVFGIEPRLPDSEDHIFFDFDDLPRAKRKCGVEHDHVNDTRHIFSEHLRVRRGLADETKYVALVLVVDKRQYDRFKNVTKVIARAIEVSNHVDQLLKTVKARAALVYVETWNVIDLALVSHPAMATLGSISSYDRQVLGDKLWKKRIRRDNVQLLTGIDFDGAVIGMAGIGTICGLSSTGVNMDGTGHPGATAATVAHELGHNLGMAHDVGGCACRGKHCVMAASGGGIAAGYTQCSKADFDNRAKQGLCSCLFDVPDKLFGPSVCGNDFLEDGEECDCGTVAECIANNGSACCNATTCKLHSTAQCAVGPCCKDCKFIRQGKLCRKPETECDFEEVCTGLSHECPGNYYKEDGTPCRNDTAYCFEGGCRTHKEQCERLWGKGADMAHYGCFVENMKGTDWSNCGQDSLGKYQKCTKQDVLCGSVQCENTPNKFPILGTGDRFRFRSVPIFENGRYIYIQCKQGYTQLGPDLDNPTLTQQGTKCGEGKICVNRECRNMTSLDFINPCANGTCYNNGRCNNLGHCHCPPGFACPDCKHPGDGGSVDSGHRCYVPSASKGLTTLAKSLLIVFLGVLPVCVLAVFLLYKFRPSLPCKPASFSSQPKASASQPKTTSSRANAASMASTPTVGYKPAPQPTNHVKNPNTANQVMNMSFSNNKGYSPSPQPPKKLPQRLPPLPPTSKHAPAPLPPTPSKGKPALPPVRPGNIPTTAPSPGRKPGKLPPLLPSKPK